MTQIIAFRDVTAKFYDMGLMGKKLAKSWTVCKSLQTKIPGNNRVLKIQGKIQIWNFQFFGQILRLDSTIFYFI